MKFLTDFTYRNLHGFARFPGDSTALVKRSDGRKGEGSFTSPPVLFPSFFPSLLLRKKNRREKGREEDGRGSKRDDRDRERGEWKENVGSGPAIG